MDQYEVCPGRMVKIGKATYPPGALVPGFDGMDLLVENGTIRAVEVKEVKRPEPVKAKGTPHAAFDAGDPNSVKAVPLHYLADCLAEVDDVDVLKEMHALETRKGGKDRIEERIGELTA